MPKGRSSRRLLSLTSDRPLVTRKLLLLVPPVHAAGAAKARAVANRLKAQQQQIRRAFEDVLERLESVTGHGFRPVGIQIREHISAGKAIGHVLAESPAASDYRGYSDLGRAGVDQQGPTLAELDISHLVAIDFESNRARWAWGASDGYSLARIQTGEELFASLVVDILLDISVFHSWPTLVNTHLHQDSRERLSRMQAAFALRDGPGKTYYGPLVASGVEYVSFASIVRRSSHFGNSECRDYMQLWYDFVEREILKRPAGASDRLMSLEEVMTELAENYHFAGQTNLNRLRRELSALPSDQYVLVRVTKRPRHAHDRVALRSLMHGGLPRVGRTRIVLRRNLGPYIPYGMFLDFRDIRINNDPIGVPSSIGRKRADGRAAL